MSKPPTLATLEEMQRRLSEEEMRALAPEGKQVVDMFDRLAIYLQDIQEQTRPFENVPDAIYQLKITLCGSKPPIWRRILVKNTLTLATLHDIIQIAMGWEDCHLYDFTRGKYPYIVSYRAPYPEEPFGDSEFNPERDVHNTLLKEALAQEKQKLTYLYDFGDSWEHTLLLEKILPVDQQVATHLTCLKAKGACPPEDFGGIGTYQWFLDAYFDAKDPDHKAAKARLEECFEGEFDASHYDIDAINSQLMKIKQ